MRLVGRAAGVTGRVIAAGALIAAGIAVVPGLVASASASSAGSASGGTVGSAAAPLAPLRAARPGHAIAGTYIVVLKPADVMPDVLRQLWNQKRVQAEYHGALRGFAATLDAAGLDQVRRDPQVSYVEPDQTITADVAQNAPDWGLDRIDQRMRPVDRTYTFTSAGYGVRAYVIDTGIYPGNRDFGGRVAAGYSAVNDGRGTADCNGHGTHVAGTIGGNTYGVAKLTLLVPVRVLDCNGQGATSQVIAGVDWVTSHHQGASVANLSLGGGVSAALDAAVTRSIQSGVTYSVAAGNSNANACNASPARVPAAITVGATDASDRRASYSNYGTCVDLFAPGSNITSTWNSGPTATAVLSGTSMATPHVTGVAALYLQNHLTATPAQVAGAVTGQATPFVVSGPGTGSPNKLLYSLIS